MILEGRPNSEITSSAVAFARAAGELNICPGMILSFFRCRPIRGASSRPRLFNVRSKSRSEALPHADFACLINKMVFVECVVILFDFDVLSCKPGFSLSLQK